MTRKTLKQVKKMEFEPVILPNLVVQFKRVLTGSPGLDIHDPDCEVGQYFQIWTTNGQWSWGPSGPRTTYYDRVTIKGNNLIDKNGKTIECDNAKQIIKLMKEKSWKPKSI